MTDQDWHEWRRQGIGASDIAPILGLSPYAGPWQIWAEKTGLLPPRQANTAMDFGKRADKMIAEWFQDDTGLWVRGQQTQCVHPDHPWARCTIDGYVTESAEPAAGTDEDYPDPIGLLESKTAGFALWDEIPPHYQAQAQWQMFVTGLDHVWMPVLHGKRLHIYELDRDQEDIDWMFQEATTFWRYNVEQGHPPEPTSDDIDTIHTVWPGEDRTNSIYQEINGELAHRYRQDLELVKLAEQRRDDYKAQILEQAKNADTLTVNGITWFTLRQQTRQGNIDPAALKADGIDPDKYRKPDTTYRVLRSTGDT